MKKQKHVSTKVRKETATLKVHEKGPRGGTTKYEFPMPDKSHARAALRDLPKAKGLSAEQKAKVRRRAEKMLGHSKKK